MEFMISGKMLVDEKQEFLTDIGLYSLAEWWIKPDDVSLSLSLPGRWRVVCEYMPVSASRESILVVSL